MEQLSDGVGYFVKYRERILGDVAVGPKLAGDIASMLIWLDALPFHVSRVGDWWVIACEVDWLRDHQPRGSWLVDP